ncbi:MAG TPA: hypothetical protein VI699_04700, partial [Candidatus Acidoferrales bacterium]|nr:hypothetical protein [Candidatus Acidoferrales bacterium]
MKKKSSAGKSKARSKSSGFGGQWMGKSVPAKEMGRLVRGMGKFVDDYKLQGMLHLWVARSPHAHARIETIDVTAAAQAPGVVAVMTGKDVAQQVQ